MLDWLGPPTKGQALPSEWVVMARVGLSLVMGFVVAGVYHVSLPRRKSDTLTLSTTLVLLTVLLALVTQVIGDNVALAFGLVGALSIVRFRTVVEDTRDTAFVMFAVVVGMAVGSGYALLAIVGIPVVALAAIVMRHLGEGVAANGGMRATLLVRVGLGQEPEALLRSAFDHHLESVRLTAAATARQGAVIELTYTVRLRHADAAIAFVAELNRVEGVQGVELRGQDS